MDTTQIGNRASVRIERVGAGIRSCAARDRVQYEHIRGGTVQRRGDLRGARDARRVRPRWRRESWSWSRPASRVP